MSSEQRDLRERIKAAFRTATDLEAFLIDYFPAIARRIPPDMEVEAQLNLLLKSLSEDQKSELGQILDTRMPGRLLERVGWDSRLDSRFG